MEGELLRVHSADLHDHVAQEVGECLESELHADLVSSDMTSYIGRIDFSLTLCPLFDPGRVESPLQRWRRASGPQTDTCYVQSIPENGKSAGCHFCHPRKTLFFYFCCRPSFTAPRDCRIRRHSDPRVTRLSTQNCFPFARGDLQGHCGGHHRRPSRAGTLGAQPICKNPSVRGVVRSAGT